MFLVDAELAGVGAQEAHGRLHVVKRQRKLKHRRQAIADGRRHVAVLRQADGHGQIAVAHAAAEASAMDQDNAGIFAGGFRTDHVHGQLAMRDRGVVDAALHNHVGRNLQLRRRAQGGYEEE